MLFPGDNGSVHFGEEEGGNGQNDTFHYIYYAGRLRWAASSPPAGGARRGAFLSPRLPPTAKGETARRFPPLDLPSGDGRRRSAAAESWEDYSWQKRRIYPPRIGKTAFRRADPGPETRDIAYAYRPDHNRWNGQDVRSGNWFVL